MFKELFENINIQIGDVYELNNSFVVIIIKDISFKLEVDEI